MKTVVKTPEAGDIVVCPNGHLVCRCKESVAPNTVCDPSQFEWFQSVPAAGTMMACEECGYSYSLGGLIVAGLRVAEPVEP